MHKAVHNFITADGAASRGDAGGSGPVLVVAGLAFEARIARACRGVAVLYGVGHALTDPGSALSKQLSDMAAGASGIVSFGTAGGLDPQWVPGDCLLGTHIISERAPHGSGAKQRYSSTSSTPLASAASGDAVQFDTRYQAYATDVQWLETLSRALPEAHRVKLFGAHAPVVSAGDKAALFARSQAGAVDMESHHLARLAALHGLPFAICRIVIDHADQNVPPAAIAGMSADGHTHLLPILASLCKQPSQLPALLRLGRDAGRAQRAMKAIGAKMPDRFGLPY